MILPEVVTPEDLAKRMGWAPKRLRRFAKTIGACHVLGNRMIFTGEDVDAILDATKVPPEGPAPTVRHIFRSARQRAAPEDHTYEKLLARLEANKVRAKEERRQARIAARVQKVKLTPRTPVDGAE